MTTRSAARARGARGVLAAALAAVAVVASGCGERDQPRASAPAGASAPPTRAGAGVSVAMPRGWHLVRPPITSVVFPADRLLLTSYPTKGGGNCAPDRAVRDLPPDGALVSLFEYRPQRGDPWQNLRRRDFPPRPAHFALRARDRSTFECWRVPSHLIRFRAADRPFQMHVALGAKAGAARRAELRRVLDSLRFTALPAPPPDPYAGWRTLTDETGDSLRTPPGWRAAATSSPRRYPRPRALFFASNRRQAGLAVPATRRAPHRLPGPFPARALDAFAADGVLLWVREEPRGPASPDFPRRPVRSWPQPRDFLPAQGGPAQRWPQLRWERAAAASSRQRFSVWVISGASASERDRALARKAAAALALSGGSFRDAPCRRGCRIG